MPEIPRRRLRATRVLPDCYVLFHRFDQSRYRRATWLLLVVGALIFLVSFKLLTDWAEILDPGCPTTRLHFELTWERLALALRLLLPVGLVLLLHEGIHALCLWAATRARPLFVVMLKGLGGIGVRAPHWYLPRNAFLVANLAPVTSLTLTGLLLMGFIPLACQNLLPFCIALNLAGSIADMVSSAYVALHPASAYITTEGSIYHPLKRSDSSGWRCSLRSLVERFFTLVEGSPSGDQ